MDKWLSRVESSQWLSYVKETLNCACLVSQCIDQETAAVLLHGGEGLDSTLAVSALAQVILSPDSRTVHGYCRNWFSTNPDTYLLLNLNSDLRHWLSGNGFKQVIRSSNVTTVRPWVTLSHEERKTRQHFCCSSTAPGKSCNNSRAVLNLMRDSFFNWPAILIGLNLVLKIYSGKTCLPLTSSWYRIFSGE